MTRPIAGDLVSVVSDHQIAVMKVLAVDDGGVHVRLYVERFTTRPSSVDTNCLSLAAFGAAKKPFSIGHMPMTYQRFLGWQPEPCGRADVQDEELEGYRIWLDSKGGYF